MCLCFSDSNILDKVVAGAICIAWFANDCDNFIQIVECFQQALKPIVGGARARAAGGKNTYAEDTGLEKIKNLFYQFSNAEQLIDFWSNFPFEDDPNEIAKTLANFKKAADLIIERSPEHEL